MYEGPFNPLEYVNKSFKGKALISLRTEELQITVKKSLSMKNIIFEGRNAHMDPQSECLYTVLGCCSSLADLNNQTNRCFIRDKYESNQNSGEENYPFIYLKGDGFVAYLEV